MTYDLQIIKGILSRLLFQVLGVLKVILGWGTKGMQLIGSFHSDPESPGPRAYRSMVLAVLLLRRGPSMDIDQSLGLSGTRFWV